MDYVEYFSHPNHAVERIVIWLHGLGDSGHGWLSATQYLKPNYSTHFILPHAPTRPITINGGYVMPGWYDIASMDFRDRGDEPGIRASGQSIHTLIDSTLQQHTHLTSQSIILAGFSQGGAIALHAGLRYPTPLAGIVALSTYLPLGDTLKNEAHPVNLNIPICMMHGTLDAVIPIEIAKQSLSTLKACGYTPEWTSYTMAHEASPQELNDITNWLNLH